MKFFFGYKENGSLASVDVHTFGWPECDCSPGCTGLSNPDCQHERCVSLRQSRATSNPEIIGYIAYNCPCPSTEMHCQDPSHLTAHGDSLVRDGQLVAKPVMTLLLDGEEVENGATVPRAPGSVAKLKLIAPEMPDGSTANCTQVRTARLTIGSYFELTFSGGETSEVELKAPAQGGVGGLQVTGDFVRPSQFTIIGWEP